MSRVGWEQPVMHCVEMSGVCRKWGRSEQATGDHMGSGAAGTRPMAGTRTEPAQPLLGAPFLRLHASLNLLLHKCLAERTAPEHP